MSIGSLNKRHHILSQSSSQIEVLENTHDAGIVPFKQKMETFGMYPLKPTTLDIFQINVGKMCNQVCQHCHVDAGPDRKEIMTKETMQQCLTAIQSSNVTTVDLTGGAPEMNPYFRWFVEEIAALGKEIIVRCNLTIILANPKYHDLPEFFRKHKVNVVSSLPYFTARRTNAQRGEGVFEKSIEALRMLNAVGYGMENSGLKLDLVYNPSGAFLPGDQQSLEKDFKIKLLSGYGAVFNNLFTISNLPVSRFLEYLVNSGNYESYMQELVAAFNPSAAAGVMCRNTISVGWDGYLYDCDFNQMLDLKIKSDNHIADFNFDTISNREIILNQHCYGCTAGAGSSCGGSLT